MKETVIMKKLISVLAVLVCCSSAFSQVSILGKPNRGLHFNLSIASSELPFDGGEARMLSLKPLPGITVSVDLLGLDFSPGLWMLTDLNIKNGDEENWRTGLVLGFVGYKNALIGVNWNFMQEGKGVQGINKNTLTLVLGLRLKTFGK